MLGLLQQRRRVKRPARWYESFRKSPSYWAIIPAAGVGKRMQTTTPKQYLRIAGQLVIDKTLTPIIQHPLIHTTYVALSETDPYWATSVYAQHPAIKRVTGGKERSASVLNALHALAEHAADDDWVLVHDAARPYLCPTDIDHLIAQVTAHPTAAGGLLGSPVRDTLKRVDNTGEINHTQDREQLWHAYTPQMCQFGLLYQSLEATQAAGIPVTDEASAMEHIGATMLMVKGRADNLKITYPEDITDLEFTNMSKNQIVHL